MFFSYSRSTFDAAKKKKKSPNAKAASSPVDDDKQVDDGRYVGCFGSENAFIDKTYMGGSTGANYGLALHHAKSIKKRYFAIARGGGDGHSFAFNSLDTSKQTFNGGGCERPCADLEDKVCGCMDAACTGPVPKGEEHNRRWAVYEITSARK